MKEQSISLNELSLAIIQHHQDLANTPVIYLHGWLDNAASFSKLAPLVIRPGWALDLPGHGMSAHIAKACFYHFIDGVSCIVQLIEHLGFDKCILIGHSLGGCLASIVAASIPARIQQLILLDAIGPLVTPTELAVERYQRYLKALPIIERKRLSRYESITQACEHRAKLGYISAEDVYDIVKRGLIKQDDAYLWRYDTRLHLPSPLQMTQAHVIEFLKQITCPTLLLNASDGFKFNSKFYQERIYAVKNIEVHTVEAGHHLHIEAAQECATLINQFIYA